MFLTTHCRPFSDVEAGSDIRNNDPNESIDKAKVLQVNQTTANGEYNGGGFVSITTALVHICRKEFERR